MKLFTWSFNNTCFSNAKYLEWIAHTKAQNWFCYFIYKTRFDHVFIYLKDWITKLFTSPRFNKTLVLVKSRVKKYRPRLHNNRTSINQTTGLVFLTNSSYFFQLKSKRDFNYHFLFLQLIFTLKSLFYFLLNKSTYLSLSDFLGMIYYPIGNGPNTHTYLYSSIQQWFIFNAFDLSIYWKRIISKKLDL